MNIEKILKDPLYSKLWSRTKNYDLLTKAGFFDDGLAQLNYHVNILTTPVDKITKPKTQEPVVLLTTGGFAPVHEGHLNMMNLAKESLVSQGYEVIGGYFSPSHDAYVHKKYIGAEQLSIYEKIELLRKATEQSDFLMVDGWEGLYTPTAINFTDVIFRLEQYLFCHLGFKVKIAYVFGGDNVGFSQVFVNSNYLSVCVARNNDKEFYKLKKELSDNANIIFIEQNSYAEVSSRNLLKPELLSQSSNLPYLVRNDLSFYNIEQLWSKKIEKIIQRFTTQPVLSLDLVTQQSFVDSLTKSIINLDPLVQGGIKVEVSRVFPIATGQYRSQQLVNRPGSISLIEQVKKIPPGNYCLVEDDVASGFTVNYLKSLLPDNVKINEIKTLTEHSFYQYFSSNAPFNFFDIVDMRDFILGLTHGGLVVNLPNGQIARSIYALPFVNLSSRAKIDPKLVVEMSKQIWILNKSYYEHSNKQLKDLDQYTQNLFSYLGFNYETLVVDICQFMIGMHYV